MQTFNAISSAVFQIILAPLGFGFVWFDLLVWPVLAGVGALWVYKLVSNQAGIKAAKNRIMVNLLEVVLYREDVVGVLRSTIKALGNNLVYLAHNLLPMVVMIGPMVVLMVQLVAHYAYAPLPEGAVELFEVKLDRAHATVATRDVTLDLPDGVALDAPPVRTPNGEIAWRLRFDDPGDFVLTLHIGDEVVEKGVAVGGEPRLIPVMRTKTLDAILYPGEPALAADSAVETASLHYPDRDLGLLPGGELGILGWFLVSSLVAGFALKDRFGVTL